MEKAKQGRYPPQVAAKAEQVGPVIMATAVPGNPLDDITLMPKVSFVMKDGMIYKEDGKPVGTTP